MSKYKESEERLQKIEAKNLVGFAMWEQEIKHPECKIRCQMIDEGSHRLALFQIWPNGKGYHKFVEENEKDNQK